MNSRERLLTALAGGTPDRLPGDGDTRWICSDNWRIEAREQTGSRNKATRYDIVTPDGTLSTVLEETHQTVWVVERLIKNKANETLATLH